ncbi:MAG: DMT family transporter, partial [Deltaproteobacteria bacterium]|nr:DMT family transporter [Deltaproteobacteria bacterium]
MKKNANLGLWLAVASPLTFTFFNAGVRIIADEMSVLGLLLLRGCTGVLLVGIFSLILRKKPWAERAPFLCLIGFIGAISTTFTTYAFATIPLYQAVVILYLYPSQSAVLSALINREKISARDAWGIVLAFFGCAILVWPFQAGGFGLKLGHFTAFFGGGLYALSIVLTRRMGSANTGLEPIFFYSLFAALSAVPLSLISGVSLGINGSTEILHGAVLGLIGSSAQLLAYMALRYIPPYKVGVIGGLEILGSAIISLLIFHDHFGLNSIIGGTL